MEGVRINVDTTNGQYDIISVNSFDVYRGVIDSTAQAVSSLQQARV